MLGDRDSEVCVVFEDTVMIDGKMDGKPYPVGEFCHGLRCYLFRYILLTHVAFHFYHLSSCYRPSFSHSCQMESAKL